MEGEHVSGWRGVTRFRPAILCPPTRRAVCNKWQHWSFIREHNSRNGSTQARRALPRRRWTGGARGAPPALARLLHASHDECASPAAREDAARLLHSTVVIDASGGWLALWRRKLGSQVLHAEPRSTLHRLSLLLLPFRRASPICARRPSSTRTRLSSTLPPAHTHNFSPLFSPRNTHAGWKVNRPYNTSMRW